MYKVVYGKLARVPTIVNVDEEEDDSGTSYLKALEEAAEWYRAQYEYYSNRWNAEFLNALARGKE